MRKNGLWQRYMQRCNVVAYYLYKALPYLYNIPTLIDK